MAGFTFSEVKVGLMVVLATVLIVALTISVGNFETFFSKNVDVKILVESVEGLENFAKVTYAGVPIGRVIAIDYNRETDQAVIHAKIDLSYPVAQDSNVQITSSGLLSPLFINIVGGSEDKRFSHLLAENEIDHDDLVLQAEPNYSIGEVLALTDDVKSVLGKVEEVLDSLHEPLQNVSSFVHNVSYEITVIAEKAHSILNKMDPRLQEILDNTSHFVISASAQAVPAIQSLRLGADKLPGLLSKTGQDINRVLAGANDFIQAVSPETSLTIKELRNTVGDFRFRIKNVEDSLTQLLIDLDDLVIDNRDELDEFIVKLNHVMANMEDLSKQLAKNPWRLIWKTEERKEPIRQSPEWHPLIQDMDSAESQ